MNRFRRRCHATLLGAVLALHLPLQAAEPG